MKRWISNPAKDWWRNEFLRTGERVRMSRLRALRCKHERLTTWDYAPPQTHERAHGLCCQDCGRVTLLHKGRRAECAAHHPMVE